MTTLALKNNEITLAPEIIEKVIAFEQMAKDVKAAEDKLKADILAEMEEKGILKFDTGKLLITYVPETQRESFDTKAFRADFPELYDDFVKLSPVKSSIRIKVR